MDTIVKQYFAVIRNGKKITTSTPKESDVQLWFSYSRKNCAEFIKSKGIAK